MKELNDYKLKTITDQNLENIKGGGGIPWGMSYYGLLLELPDVIKAYKKTRHHH